MRVGQLVMLIDTDGFMPNLGAIGEVCIPFDGEDYGIEFPAWPCPVGPETCWYVPPSMLMRIGPLPEEVTEHELQPQEQS